ncbi:MAG: hypothetical protein ACOCX3_01845 [Chloroflexota bacterium]
MVDQHAALARRRVLLPLALFILLVAAGLRFAELHQLPPGPHYDEAANILITRSIAFGGVDLFPIANSYQGRESLYFYLNAPLFTLINDDVFMLRVSSAWVNLITIAATIALGRKIFPGRRGVIIGLVAGALMAINFHQLFMSRQAYRAVTLPLTQALGFLFLWRGLTYNRLRPAIPWLVAGGVFCAAALYTYMSSRLLPFWLVLAALTLLWFDRSRWRYRLQQGAVFGVAFVVAALPMAVYALQNPDIFFQRLTEVSDGEITVSLAESVRRHLEMFFIRGDFGNLRYNIPGRPYFTGVEAPFLLIGLALAGWRCFVYRNEPGAVRAGYLLIFISPLMVLPSVIAVAGFPPSHMRSLAMVPLIFLAVGIGVEWGLSVISAWRAQFRPKAFVNGVVVGVLVIGGVLVWDAYRDWATRADLFYQADGDLALAAEWLPDHVDTATSVYISAYHREHPTIRAMYGDAVTWLGGDSFILPPPDETGIVVFSRATPPAADWLALLNDSAKMQVPLGPDDAPAFMAYRLDSTVQRPDGSAIAAPSNQLMTLVFAEVDQVRAGQSAELTMAWRIDQPVPYYRLRPVITVYDSVGGVLAFEDLFLLGTDAWRPGEIVFQKVQFDVPVGTPPGHYSVAVRWVDRDSGAYVNYLSDDGGLAGIEADIALVRVSRPETFPSVDMLPVPVRAEQDVMPGVRLLGWDSLPEVRRPGERLPLRLYWQAVALSSENVVRPAVPVEVLLQNGEGAIGGPETETVIWSGELDHSFDEWIDGELVTLPLLARLPADTVSGQYTVVLRTAMAEVSVGQLNVQGQPRLFEQPPVQVMTQADYGGVIELTGYTLNIEGNQLSLDLVWRALGPVDTDYTVFVHLVNTQGEVVYQRDAYPQNGAYPTSLWQTGEYVIDPYQFNGVRAGAYTLRVGLYTQVDGLRLPVTQALIANDFMRNPDNIEIYTEIHQH